MKTGDKVICITDGDGGGNVFDLEVGETYTTIQISFHGQYYRLYESNYQWESDKFVTIPQFRKMKIDKLKENIDATK